MRHFLLPLLAALSAACLSPAACAQGDGQDCVDPTRPVSRLGRDHATLQWFTREPCATRAQIRPGTVPCNTPGPDGRPRDVWNKPGVRVVNGSSGKSTYHVLNITGLKPGTRYSYRLYDPGARPTDLEKTWGASAPWRREYSFSTLAPKGRMTVIRIPIKVLLMPNVVNIASAHDANGQLAPPPPKLTKAQLDLIRQEYADSARFFFVNSGFRVWYDYQIFIDDRPQRWGEEPKNAGEAYKGWPVCRSYAGVDFSGPGGGDFTIVDTRSITKTEKSPVFGEKEVYVGQIEQAFPRRWNPAKKAWEFYNSGGGTFGIDEWAKGIPGRSQFLGGGDTAWLATHEYHHQIESLGAFSLANREDDRVIFDHFAPRRRVKREDGTWDEWTWSTSWKHGEHWDGIAYFDRMLTPVQWLRLHFGQTLPVADADGDGVPDDDPRLPFDEKRFGSDPHKVKTDGAMDDFTKIKLSTWASCAPLTTTWNKGTSPNPLLAKEGAGGRFMPNPHSVDSDGDGLPDTADPYPLYPWQPFIWPMTATVDGRAGEWADIPLAGKVEAHGVAFSFRQGHDDAAYYACFTLKGPWARVAVGLDGEGQGYYTTNSTYAFDIVNPAGGGAPTVRVTSGNQCPGMQWKAGTGPDGEAVVEVSIPNRGEGLWFWTGGGREVGAEICLSARDGRPLSPYEPYNFFYARMLERAGRAELPSGAPKELADGPDVRSFDFTQAAPDPGWKFIGAGWEWKDGALRHHDTDVEDIAYLMVPDTTEFDLWAEFEAANDMHMGAWQAQTKPGSETDYVAFLGGFGNARSVIRLFGQEAGAEDTGIPPGRHTMQLTRRGKQVWLMLDGKPVAYAADPTPDMRVNRIGFIGGWGGNQTLYRARIRTK
jgi:hypothetical protein